MVRRFTRQHGMTLIELGLAIVIVAVMSAVILPVLLTQAERSRESRARGDVAGLAKAIAKMRSDTGVVAANCLTNLTNLTSSTLPAACTNPNVTNMTDCTAVPAGTACWAGPYVGQVATDPWGLAYQVSVDSTTWAVTVLSIGPDQIAGDSDDISYVQ